MRPATTRNFFFIDSDEEDFAKKPPTPKKKKEKGEEAKKETNGKHLKPVSADDFFGSAKPKASSESSKPSKKVSNVNSLVLLTISWIVPFERRKHIRF